MVGKMVGKDVAEEHDGAAAPGETSRSAGRDEGMGRCAVRDAAAGAVRDAAAHAVRDAAAHAVRDAAAGTVRDAAAHAVRDVGVGSVQRKSGGTMAYLKDLAAELQARGLLARVVRGRRGPAFVRVVNPVATTIHESVSCAPSPAGLHDWYYWWSWGECMHRVGDPAGAASKVARVLHAVAAPAG